MAHEIDFSLGYPAIAYVGETPWHKLGAKMDENMSPQEWQKAAGLDWEAQKQSIYLRMEDENSNTYYEEIPDKVAIVRNDTHATLGIFTPYYTPAQPTDLFNFLTNFFLIDSRFKLEVAGSLKGGKKIWALARFDQDMNAGGDRHSLYALVTTSFDGTLATTVSAMAMRVVCNNTLVAGLNNAKQTTFRLTHRQPFDTKMQELAHSELQNIISNFEQYKHMADAMAQSILSKEEIEKFFKTMVGISHDASLLNVGKGQDVSRQKLTQYDELNHALYLTQQEGTETSTKWGALQAVTQWIDHHRSTRAKGDSEDKMRLFSANFGSGQMLKSKALELLAA